MDFERPESLKGPIYAPKRILMAAGPSNIPPSVIETMSIATMGVLQPEFMQVANI